VAPELHIYPDGGATELREAIARKHGLAADQVIVGNGSDEVLTLAAAALIEPGDEGITAEHTFSQYAFATRLYGGVIRLAPMQAGTFDLDGLLASIGPRTRVLFVCNPNNPTGTYRSHDELAEFLSKVPKEILVVIDEAYADYALAPDFPRSEELLEEHENLLILRTFSKIYGLAGLRVGYGIGSDELISMLGRARQPFNSNSAAQTAALAALTDEEHRVKSVELNQKSYQLTATALDERGISHYPSEANFICVDLGRDTKPIYEELARGGITVRTLHSFGLPTMLRITLGPLDVMERLLGLLDEALETAPLSKQ
jgi:histidinol-phosphate aminotransferase